MHIAVKEVKSVPKEKDNMAGAEKNTIYVSLRKLTIRETRVAKGQKKERGEEKALRKG